MNNYPIQYLKGMRRYIVKSSLLLIPLATFTSTSQAQCDYIIGDIVWQDEFDYTGQPDPNKWGYDVGNSGWGNNELQYYTDDRRENARVENGTLIIESRNENYGGSNYTSARMVTAGKGDWLYGRIEVMAKVPLERGTWPAIWMLPTDWEYGGWPASGETDIMEGITAWGVNKGESHANIHTQSYNHLNGTNKGATINNLSDMDVNFHLYAVDWYPDRMEFSVDNQYFFTFQNEGNWEAWPYDKRFHLILNVAIGGTLGGSVENQHFPHQMIVDYVRVYDLKATDGNTFPYNDVAAVIPGTIEAEFFDEGCDAYSDNDVGNQGTGPRSGDVDIEATTDVGGGYNVGWTGNGEWLKYTVDVQTTGTYNLKARVASGGGGGSFQVSIDGTDVTNEVTAPGTGDWQNWETVDAGTFNLTKGVHELVFNVVNEGFNFNYLTLDLLNSAPEISRTNDLDVFPNPVTNKLHVKGLTTVSDFSVMSVTGQVLRTGQVSPNHAVFDTQDLAKGAYFLKLKNELGVTQTIRFSK